ncbi:MAG: copper transporter, partial [Solirubrobacterales bacterium]
VPGHSEAVSGRREQPLPGVTGELVAVGVVRQPTETTDLSKSLELTRFARLDRRPAILRDYGVTVGKQMISGGRIFRLSRDAIMSETSGLFGDLDGLIIYRENPEDLSPADVEQSNELDDAMIEGMKITRADLVGVEEVSTEPSSVEYFSERGISTVDNIDLPVGRLSLVYTLGGAQGSFGVKETSDRLLPYPLRPFVAPGVVGGEQG